MSTKTPISPYVEAWQWINANAGTDGARSLAKLLLSLWRRAEHPYPFGECVDKLDDSLTDMALRIVIHYSNFPDEHGLAQIGAQLREVYPGLFGGTRVANRVIEGDVRREYTLRNEADAAELDAAWCEIVTRQSLPRTEALARDTEEIMERARIALEIRVDAIQSNPGTNQCRRLVSFLAGLDNAADYPFALSELRGLDRRLSMALP